MPALSPIFAWLPFQFLSFIPIHSDNVPAWHKASARAPALLALAYIPFFVMNFKFNFAEPYPKQHLSIELSSFVLWFYRQSWFRILLIHHDNFHPRFLLNKKNYPGVAQRAFQHQSSNSTTSLKSRIYSFVFSFEHFALPFSFLADVEKNRFFNFSPLCQKPFITLG